MSQVALVAVWVLTAAQSPYPLEEQSTLLMPFECLNASWPNISSRRPRGPKLLVDMHEGDHAWWFGQDDAVVSSGEFVEVSIHVGSDW
jgi:hypothetical protein